MAEFQGTIRLEDGESLATRLLVDEGRLRVTAGDHEIGNWAIEELTAERRNGEVRLSVEDDELVFGVDDPIGLADALGVKEKKAKQRRGKKPKGEKRPRRRKAVQSDEPAPVAARIAEPPVPALETSPAPSAEQTEEKAPSLWSRLSPRTKMVGAGAVGLLMLGVINPNLLAILLLFAGLAVLFLAIAAKGEGGGTTGFHPPAIFATDLAVGVGFGMVLIAILIMAIT